MGIPLGMSKISRFIGKQTSSKTINSSNVLGSSEEITQKCWLEIEKNTIVINADVELQCPWEMVGIWPQFT